MKAWTLFSAAALAVVVGSAAVRADGIVGSNGAAWQPFPGSLNDSTNPNRPYWDQDTPDAPKNNVGNLVITTPGPDWWGIKGPLGRNADTNFHFTHDPAAGMTEGLLTFEISGNAAGNMVGWYNSDNPSERHILWDGSAAPTTAESATFAPSGNYGFWIEGSLGLYYTESKLNIPSEQFNQHFAVFALNLQPGVESWTIGIEDLDFKALATEPAGDYQDFVFNVISTSPAVPSSLFGLPAATATGVPEPATLTLVGAGIPGLLVRRRAATKGAIARG